jgi:hypothetical protein
MKKVALVALLLSAVIMGFSAPKALSVEPSVSTPPIQFINLKDGVPVRWICLFSFLSLKR